MAEIVKTKALDGDGHEHVRPALFIDERLLDYVYVWSCSLGDYDTAYTYLSQLNRFIEYLINRSSQPFIKEAALKFWEKVSNKDLKDWQRIRMRANQLNKKKASFDTVRAEARTVLRFMSWVHDQGVSLLFEPKKKVILEKAQAEDGILRGIDTERREKEVIDYDLIEVPDPIKERSQSEDIEEEDLEIFVDDTLPNDHGWLPIDQFLITVDAFSDPVYEAMSYSAFHTGVRNFELMGFPTVTAGREFVCNPRELQKKLRNGEKEMLLRIPKGKGGNARTIPIDIESWLWIMSIWWPVREERKRKLMDKTGIELGIDQLWISKSLVPLYCNPLDDSDHKTAKDALSSAFYWISSNKANLNSTSVLHGFKANFYKLRHTFATLYVYEVMRENEIFDGGYWITNLSLRNDLMNRMGHKILKTTFEHYVEEAVILHSNTEGKGGVWYPAMNYIQHLEERSRLMSNAH